MKTKLIILCLFIFAACTKGFSQQKMTINMNDKDCIHVVDGLVSSHTDDVPAKQLANFEQAASEEKVAEFGFGGSQCVMVKSSADLDIENYIYRQVHAQVQQIGTKYKIPIAVNEKLVPSYTDRRSQLSNIKQEQIKKIKFLNKAEAQAKYGDKVVFGLIEITV